MAETTKVTIAPQRKLCCPILLAIAVWNLLLVITIPILGNVFDASHGFSSRSIWFSLLTNMIRLHRTLAICLVGDRQVLTD